MSAGAAPSSRRPAWRQAIMRPGRAVSVSMALARGWWIRLWCAMRGVRFSAGRNFRVSGRVIVRGPGRVTFGDNVTIGMTVTPWTYRREAAIIVGDNVFLNGTRFGCAAEIRIGADSIIADAHIFDTNFHSTRRDRHNPAAPVRTAPVTIGTNVWIAAASGVLPGTTIGDDAVVGFGSVCSGTFPGGVIIAGNPAIVVRPIPADGASHA